MFISGFGCNIITTFFRIADLFTHNEADDIKDRKDKFKRYLNCTVGKPGPIWSKLTMSLVNLLLKF